MGKIPLRRGAIYEVDILDKIAAKGRGIARYKDFVIFVKGAVPGQKVKVQITRIKPNYAEAKVLELLKKSPIEVEAKCSHFGSCGGCVWQNLTYEKQLELKEKQVQETLQHLGKVKSFEMLPIVKSPIIWDYRNKVEFSFGYGKMWVEKKEDDTRVYHDEEPCLGFHKSERWEQIVKIDRCHIFTPKSEQILKIFNDAVNEGKFEVYNPKTHRGFLRQVMVRSTADTENLLLNIVVNTIPKKGEKKKPKKPLADLKLEYGLMFAGIIQDLKKIAGMHSILITESDSLSDALKDPQPILMWGQDCIYEKLGDLRFKVSPFSFFQTNTKGAQCLYNTIEEFAGLTGNERIIDLYCGTGAIGLYLAKKAKYVYGVESNLDAISDAKENAKLNNITNIEFIPGAVENELRTVNAIIKDCEINQIIVDPPRSGMHKSVVSTLSKAGIKKITYVSCNPATLARDVEQFVASGYQLTKVQPVDMFPHTSHVEAVAELILGK